MIKSLMIIKQPTQGDLTTSCQNQDQTDEMWCNLETKVQFNPAKDDISEQARGFVHSVLLLRIRKPSAHDQKFIDSQLVQPQKNTFVHGGLAWPVC